MPHFKVDKKNQVSCRLSLYFTYSELGASENSIQGRLSEKYEQGNNGSDRQLLFNYADNVPVSPNTNSLLSVIARQCSGLEGWH